MGFFHGKLREERKARDLTIKQLSEMSRVSAGMVSSIERGIVNPSVDVLFRICNALNLTIDHFLQNPGDRNGLYILKKSEQYFMENKTSFTYFVSPLFEQRGHSVFVTNLKQGGEYGRKHISHEINELIVVIDGKLVLHYGESEFTLEKGDSAYFGANHIHYVKNPFSETAILVWCIFKAR